MHLTIHFVTDYGKDIVMTIYRDKYGEDSIRNISINKAFYTGKQIRTARRETILYNYALRYVDIDEQFADAQAENFRRYF